MANPFDVYVPQISPLAALTQGYGFTSGLRSKQAQQQARHEAQQAILSGGDTRGALARLIGIGDAETAKVVASMGPKPNAEIEKLEMLQRRPDLMATAQALRRAAANSTTINMPPQEKAYDQAVGKEFAEQNIGIIKSAGDAQRKIATLDRLGTLLSDPNIYTGAGGEQVLQAKRLAKMIGIDIGEVSGAEAARSISNQFALELRNPAGGAGMPGAMSDKDREFLQASVPSLQQSPQGNAKIVDFMKRVASRAIQVEKLRQDYVKRNGRLNEGFYQTLSQFSDANPLFPEAGQVGSGQSRTGVKWRVVQ